MNRPFYMYHGKRLFDFIAALAGLFFLSPLLLVVAIAVRLDSPGPSFFLQERTGRFRRSFRIIKFRTMKQATSGDAPLITAAGDCRITYVGRWLRKTKVDELPQLFNVLFGDMSLVGPRPEVPRYTRLYTEDQMQVFLARPGVTSPATLASVKEEETLDRQSDAEAYYLRCLMPAKLKLDLAYCRNITFCGDVRLICRTVGRLLQSRNSERAEENKLNANAEELG